MSHVRIHARQLLDTCDAKIAEVKRYRLSKLFELHDRMLKEYVERSESWFWRLFAVRPTPEKVIDRATQWKSDILWHGYYVMDVATDLKTLAETTLRDVRNDHFVCVDKEDAERLSQSWKLSDNREAALAIMICLETDAAAKYAELIG